MHVKYPTKDKGPSLEEFLVFQEFVDVFEEIPELSLKKYIDLMPQAAIVSKTS